MEVGIAEVVELCRRLRREPTISQSTFQPTAEPDFSCSVLERSPAFPPCAQSRKRALYHRD